jgi:hypothetical protein
LATFAPTRPDVCVARDAMALRGFFVAWIAVWATLDGGVLTSDFTAAMRDGARRFAMPMGNKLLGQKNETISGMLSRSPNAAAPDNTS